MLNDPLSVASACEQSLLGHYRPLEDVRAKQKGSA